MPTSDSCYYIQFSYCVADGVVSLSRRLCLSVTLSGIVVVVILQSFKVFLLSGTDTLFSFRSSLSFQKFGFDFQ